jgi:ribosomal protein RSM22 (predicted rRNA methylase)
MRMTIPKSQGKQAYYDARKSEWGDIFPHESKNKMQERVIAKKGGAAVSGGDIGKRGVDEGRMDRRRRKQSYERIAEDLKLKKRKEGEDRSKKEKRERRTNTTAFDDVD